MVNSKSSFWLALIFTAAVFLVGMLLGATFEGMRSRGLQTNLINSETNLIDQQLRNRAFTNFNINCDAAVKDLFVFADRIYEEAVQLERYDSASKFDSTPKILHKRYDLLRMMLWSESIEIKKECSSNFHTLVYIYKYDDEDVDVSAEQSFYSRFLAEFKGEHPDDVLLIPFAGDTGLDSVNLVLGSYNITESDLPVIIVDEKTIIREVITSDELENIVF